MFEIISQIEFGATAEVSILSSMRNPCSLIGRGSTVVICAMKQNLTGFHDFKALGETDEISANCGMTNHVRQNITLQPIRRLLFIWSTSVVVFEGSLSSRVTGRVNSGLLFTARDNSGQLQIYLFCSIIRTLSVCHFPRKMIFSCLFVRPFASGCRNCRVYCICVCSFKFSFSRCHGYFNGAYQNLIWEWPCNL